MNSLVEKARAGNRRALARLLTMVENEREGADDALADLFPHTGQAQVIGVTGAPGTGKSTLVAALASAYRQRGRTVAILAVDPTSPFSGGAVLGDRVRMGSLAGDAGVFIRSMASRGSLGGLAHTTRQAIWVLDAVGYDVVLVETVGAGQGEVDIARTAHTTLVVEAPGLGDGIQAMKAGILEIADVLVVNKADLPGAINTVRTLEGMLLLGHPAQCSGHHGYNASLPSVPDAQDQWLPPVVQTAATEQQGVNDLIEAIDAHSYYLAQHQRGHTQERQVLRQVLLERVQHALFAEFEKQVTPETVDTLIDQLQERTISPNQAVQSALNMRNHKGTHHAP